ncbi:glycerol channel [Dimargaris xerosporica]|nr:glycerol channel [Dimargaris xerosporica]
MADDPRAAYGGAAHAADPGLQGSYGTNDDRTPLLGGAPQPHQSPFAANNPRVLRWLEPFRSWASPYLDEFIGTLIFVMLGLGVNAAAKSNAGAIGQDSILVALGWGFALTAALAVVYTGTTGFFNPAVTLVLALHRCLEIPKAIGFLLAQLAAAFVAAALVHLVFLDSLRHYRHTPSRPDQPDQLPDKPTSDVFVTYPAIFVSNLTAFLSEMLGTLVLMWVFLKCLKYRGSNAVNPWFPLVAGLTLSVLMICFRFQSGAAFNPARDFAPRLYTFIAGWGHRVFTAHSGYWWIPIVAPIVGAEVAMITVSLFSA